MRFNVFILSWVFILASWPILESRPNEVFSLTGIDLITGARQKLSIEGKDRLVVAFLSCHCPCSRSHEAEFVRLAHQYEKAGFRFVVILSNRDESRAELLEHFKKYGSRLLFIHDPSQAIANHFGAYKTPHIFIVDGKGETLYSGGMSDSHAFPRAKERYLSNVLKELASGGSSYPKETRPLGCEITR